MAKNSLTELLHSLALRTAKESNRKAIYRDSNCMQLPNQGEPMRTTFNQNDMNDYNVCAFPMCGNVFDREGRERCIHMCTCTMHL